jgi:hypothetical protein
MAEVKLLECLEPGHRIAVSEATADGRPALRVTANREGMVTLARLMLFMTQPNAKPGVAVDLGVLGAIEKSGLNLLLVRE